MEPRLYIIMRKDIPDLNPGKGMAQAAHAQADFDAYVEDHFSKDTQFREAHITWCEDRNFGVTLVLSATMIQMQEVCKEIKHSGLTVDPTYPWRNWYGELFTSSEPTCLWAFVWQQEDIEYMRQFELHQ